MSFYNMNNKNPTNTLEKKTKVDSDVAKKIPVPAPVVTPSCYCSLKADDNVTNEDRTGLS
jgi:hypothetical protein